MGSDRARLSYDAKQHYRSVVAQQGRVTLEADSNEAQQIISEELRQETLDFVGSSGTPDDGYRVIETESPTTPFDFAVQSGTMYVGGIRAFLGDPAQPTKHLYSDQTQTDWLDYKNDPDWIDSPKNSPPSDEFIYLYLREQEVSAVEDSALLDPALGGPDTTQRTRLIQRIIRLSTDKTECSSALETAIAAWKNKGLNFDPKTMRLMSAATLKVETMASAFPSDPCDPAARGGYLGAENQLIRVQISQSDSTGYKLVWGFDNASFLYRIDMEKLKATLGSLPVISTISTLRLTSQPVDDFHRPRQGQTVEVLRSAAKLSNGEYVASATGSVTTLAASYNPTSQEITLPTAPPLPTEYLDAKQTPQLFVRVWEEEKLFKRGDSVSLGKTGLQVTLQTSGNQPFHIGDYWIFAVRPTTPTEVYPKRYLEAPQPPDGPRLWVCPLAVIQWNNNSLKVLEDCRQPFDNLVELTKRKFGGGCCTVTVRPEDLKQGKTLQSILDKFTNMARVTICLMPGNYQLPKPLVLGSGHSNLILEGCHDGVILHADDRYINQFLDGLIVLTGANNVTLRRLKLELPLVPLAEAVPQFRNMEPLLAALQRARLQNLGAAIGIRPVNCNNLTIQDCIFNYSLPSEFDDLFGAGIFAGGACNGLTVRGNQFVHARQKADEFPKPKLRRVVTPGGIPAETQTATTEASPTVVNPGVGDAIATPTVDVAAMIDNPDMSGKTTTAATEGSSGLFINPPPPGQPFHILFGYLQLPSGTLTSSSSGTMGRVMRSHLQDAFFLNNQFTGLSFATLIISDIGAVKFKDNTVRECLAGFWLESLGFWTWTEKYFPSYLQGLNKENNVVKNNVFPAIYGDSKTIFGMQLALFYPLPQALSQKPEKTVNGSTLEIQPFLAAAHEPELSLSVHFSDNAVDALTKTKDEPSSIGLLILGDSPRNNGIDLREIIVSANKIRNRATNAPTTIILLAQRCTITGNLILNEAQSNENNGNRFSLVFLPLSGSNQFAITGNVLQGKSNLDGLSRSGKNDKTDLLDTWLFANSCHD